VRYRARRPKVWRHAEENLAIDQPIWASSTEVSGLEPAKAVDGDLTTWWSSAYSDQQSTDAHTWATVYRDDLYLWCGWHRAHCAVPAASRCGPGSAAPRLGAVRPGSSRSAGTEDGLLDEA
jgi:hypothetical protein